MWSRVLIFIRRGSGLFSFSSFSEPPDHAIALLLGTVGTARMIGPATQAPKKYFSTPVRASPHSPPPPLSRLSRAVFPDVR